MSTYSEWSNALETTTVSPPTLATVQVAVGVPVPSVVATPSVSASPAAAGAVSTVPAPTVLFGQTATPGAATASVGVPPPGVTGGGSVAVAAPVTSATVGVPGPSVVVPTHASAAPGVVAARSVVGGGLPLSRGRRLSRLYLRTYGFDDDWPTEGTFLSDYGKGV